jgi:signal transduction histidine kinase
MDKPDINRWSGKSSEEVLAESFHEIRNPIVRMSGYLNVLKSTDLSEEQRRHFTDEALKCALSVTDTMESVYQYMNELYRKSG